MRRVYKARKLLVASIGVASVTYAACGGQTNITTNDAGNDGGPGGIGIGVDGNLMAYDSPYETAPPQFTDGNLMPPPFEAGADVAADAPTDAGADVIQDTGTDSTDEGG